jgi:TP901 family phage tail tape measure protein
MANYDVIKTYGIEITAVTDKATEQINQLEKELDELSKKKGLSAGLQSQIDKIGETLNGLKGEIVSSTKSINDNLGKINTEKMSKEFKDMQSSIETSISGVQDKMKDLQASLDFLNDPNAGKGFASGIGKMFDELSSTINGVVSQFADVSTVMQNIMDGSFDATVLKRQTQDIKDETKNLKKYINDLYKFVEEKNMSNKKDPDKQIKLFDKHSLKNQSEDVLREMRVLLDAIDKEAKSIGNNANVESLISKKLGIGTTDVRGLKDGLNKIINGLNDEKLGSGSISEINLSYKIDSSDDKAIDSIVKQIQEKVITKVQDKLDSSPIRIPIGYTYDKALVGKDLKDIDDATGKDTEKVLFKHLNLEVNADTSKLFTEVNTKVSNLNEELKASGRKIEVEVVGKVDKSTIEQSAKELAYEIEDAQYQNAGFNVRGGNFTIDPSSGIATETTLSDIKTILAQWNTTGIPGTQSKEFKEQLKTKEANAIASSDFDKLFRTRKQSSTLIKKLQDQNDTTDSLIAKLLLRDEAKQELNKLIRNSTLKKGGEEGRKVLQGSNYYTNSFTVDGIEYAKYGDGKTTLKDWQARLNKLFDDSFDPKATESLFDTKRVFAKLNEKGEEIKNEAGEIVTEEVKIKGALKTFRERINKQNKATRESLKLNGVEFEKDEKGKYTNRILYEKGTVTSNEDAYAKSKNLANLIKEDAKEEVQIQNDKIASLNEQRKIIKDILLLEEKSRTNILSDEENERLDSLRSNLMTRTDSIATKISDRDKYDELTAEKLNLIDKRIKQGGHTVNDLKRLNLIDAELQSLFVTVDNVDDLSKVIKERTSINAEIGSSYIDIEIEKARAEIQDIVKRAQRDIGEIYKPTEDKSKEKDRYSYLDKNTDRYINSPVTNQAQFDWNQKKIAELESRNSHLERLVKQKPDKFGKTSFDYSSMTSAEKAEFFSNQKHIKALKTRNLLYAEQNNLAAELLGTTKKLNAEEKTTIRTLHVKESEKAGYEKLFGQRMSSSANSDAEFINSLSDNELSEALSSINKVVTAINKKAELSNEEIKALVQNRINEDIKFLRESLEKEEKELIEMEKKGASQKAIDNKQYRINRISASIAQLEDPKVQSSSNEKLLQEREILTKINQEQEELINNLKEKTNVRDFEIEDVKELWSLEKRLNEESSKLKDLNIDAWQHYTVNPSKMESEMHQADSIGWDQKLNSWELEEVTDELNEQIQKYFSARHALKEYKSELESLRPHSLQLAEHANISPELLDELVDIEQRRKESEDKIFELIVRKNGMSEKQFRSDVLGGGSFDPFNTSYEPDNLYNQRVDMYTDYFKNQDSASVDTVRTWLKLAQDEVATREEAKKKAIEIHETEKKIVAERQKELSLSQKNQKEIITSFEEPISNSKNEIEELENQINSLQSKLGSSKDKIDRRTKNNSINAQINEIEENSAYSLYKKIEEREQKLLEIKKDNKKVTEEIARLEKNVANKKALKFENTAKENDRLFSIEQSEKEIALLKESTPKVIKQLKKKFASLFQDESGLSINGLYNNSTLSRKDLEVAQSKYSSALSRGESNKDIINDLSKELELARNKFLKEYATYLAYGAHEITELTSNDEYINAYNSGKLDVNKIDSFKTSIANKISSKENELKNVTDAKKISKIESEILSYKKQQSELLEVEQYVLNKIQFEKQGQLQVEQQTFSLKNNKSDIESELSNLIVRKNAAESELSILKQQREETEKRLAINKEIKNFQKGMSVDQKKASLGVDYELLNIQEMEEELKTLPKTSKQYQELSKKIKIAKDELTLFRQEAEELGLTLSETTGRMYLGNENKDVGIDGLSYNGLFKERNAPDVELPDYDEQIVYAKKLNKEQVKSHHYHSAIVDEMRAESNEQARLTKMWNIAGMSDREAEVALEISKVNAQLKDKTNLTESQTEALKEQLAILHKTIETEKLDIQLGKGGYVQRKVSRSAFVANPEQFATNKYLKQMLSSSTTSGISDISADIPATEKTLVEIKNILSSKLGIKSEKQQENQEKGVFNTKGYQEVAKSLGLLKESKDGKLFVSKKDRGKVYSEMDKLGIARYLEEDTKATKKNIEAKKESKKAVDKDTDATKKNSDEKKSNTKRERGKDFGDGTKDINSDIAQARKLLAKQNLGDETRSKWQSIFDSATAEAEKRGYQKNAQGFFVGEVISDATVKDTEQKVDLITSKLQQMRERIDALEHKRGRKSKIEIAELDDLKNTLPLMEQALSETKQELGQSGKQAGKEFGESIEQGAKESLGINSPSTVFQEIAHWCGEGAKIGLDKEGNVIYGKVSDWKDKLLASFKSGQITMDDLISFKDSNQFDGRSSITKALNQIIDNNLLLDTQETTQSSNSIITALDKVENKYEALIALAKSYGIAVGENVDITEKQLKNGNIVYDFKSENGKGSLTIGTDKDGNEFVDMSKMQQLNDGYTKLQNTLKEIKGLTGYKIDILDASDPAMFGEYADKVKEAQIALSELRLVQQNGYNGEDIDVLIEKIKLVKQVSNELKGDLQVGESEIIGKIDASRLDSVRQQMESLAYSTSKGSVETQKMSKNNTELTYTVRTADNMLQTYTITMNKYNGQLKKTLVSEEKYLTGFQKALKGLGGKFQEIIRYTIASVSIYEVFNFLRQGIGVVKDMDAAMTELRKVSNDTEQVLQSFREESYKIANTIGSTGKEIVNSAADWEKLGYSIQEASELAKNSALYANVGDMEIDVATEHMVSTLKAFNIEAENSIDIVDKFNEIGNSYAITSAGIGEALERSASSLVAAGNDIDQAIALITAGNIVSQDAESVGNAVKVVSLRIRGSKTDLEEMGEETDNLASSTSKLRDELKSLTGVDIMLDDNTYKDTYTILLEISKVWNQLSDVSQANVLEKLAGKTRSSVVAGLLQQGETLEQVYKDSQNASGSAIKENEKYMESIQGHLDILTNKWQEMWDSAINAEVINGFIDFGSSILDIVNNVGLLKSLLLAGGGIFAAMKAFKGEGKWGYKIVPIS